MKLWRLSLVIIVSLLLVKCAQMKPITGGEKDEDSPIILQSSPQNFSTGFQGHTIAMEFDEYVVIKSLNSEMVVSPPLKYPIKYTIKGKRVFFEIEDTLVANTTYNFNFGKAIVDLNEGNVLDSNLIVFSTGMKLDSGEIRGTVIDAYTQKPIKATVILFNATDDSAIYNGGPRYITQTDNSGNYKLKFLSENDYQIYVLEYPGSDYEYSPFSKIGFHESTVNPKTNTEIDFHTFQEEDTAQYLSKDMSREYYNYILSFHSPLINPSFVQTPSGDSIKYIIEELKSDSFLFWIEGDLDIDSVTTYISDQTGYLDTVSMELKDRTDFYKKLKRKNQTNDPLKINLNTNKNQFDYFDSLFLRFNRPLLSWKTDSIYFVDGTDTIRLDSLLEFGKIQAVIPSLKRGTTKELRSMIVKYEWKPNHKYGLIFYPGAFTDIIHQTNDTIIKTFTTRSFEDYGSFRLTVNTPNYNGSLILELLNEKGKYLRSYYIKSGDVIYHELAKTGKYKFRIILDENANKKWDTGNLSKQLQPEKIIYHSDIIEIRPNWDMEETWNVEFR